MFRYRKGYKHYTKHPREAGCPFCDTTSRDIIRKTAHAAVIRNVFPYDIWEFRDVQEHLMVIPLRHAGSLQELTKAERQEIMELLAEYEAKCYNIYARALDSVQKTVPAHQHTHLISTGDKRARFGIYVRKPYLLVKK